MNSTLPTSVAAVAAPMPLGNPHFPTVEMSMDDVTLSHWLFNRLSEKHIITFIYADHRCKMYDLTAGNLQLFLANPDINSAKALKKLAAAKLLKQLNLTSDEFTQATVANATWILLNATSSDVTKWMKFRDAKFGQGRGKAISTNTERVVWLDAGGRCMYRGCCEDLGHTPLTAKAARVGYLAHIVASDPEGPRGDAATSHNLSDDPENIMLMCDAHHRLIDRIDESGHPVELLQDMRSERANMIRNALNGMAYPRTQIITLFSDIANIPTATSERNMRSALLARQLAPLPDIISALRRTQRDDRLPPDFWNRLLHEHELNIREFVTRCSSQPTSNSGIPTEVLAIFPLHLVPILVLAGRIVGEARPIEVFQYDRHRQTWQWDAAATPHPPNTFQLEIPSEEHANEVMLSLELSATIDERTLPEVIIDQVGDGSIPWIRITATQPNHGCIAHPDDLAQFTSVARDAIQIIHDKMRPFRVHLLGVAPASTLFRFGQILQAGHHPAYSVYDRPDQAQPFKPGLSIEGQQVRAAASLDNNDSTIIQLR